jgi:hypothetical protein
MGPTPKALLFLVNALVKQTSNGKLGLGSVRMGVAQATPCCTDDSVLLSRYRRYLKTPTDFAATYPDRDGLSGRGLGYLS